MEGGCRSGSPRKGTFPPVICYVDCRLHMGVDSNIGTKQANSRKDVPGVMFDLPLSKPKMCKAGT